MRNSPKTSYDSSGQPWPRRAIAPWLMAGLLLFLCTAHSMNGRTLSNSSPGLPLLTTVHEVEGLSQKQANRGLPVRLRGVVTYYGGKGWELFVQCKTGGIYIDTDDQVLELHSGDLIKVRGRTISGRVAPMIEKPRIRVLGRAHLPAPKRVSFAALQGGKEDSQWVETEGVVHAVGGPAWRPVMELASGKQRLEVQMPPQTAIPAGLVDAKVLIRGAAAGNYNSRGQSIGARLCVPGLKYIKVEQPALPHPFSLALRTIAILPSQSLRKEAAGHRVRITGVVEYQDPGKLLAIRGKTGSAYVRSSQVNLVQPGDVVNVVGFIGESTYAPVLEDAIFRGMSARASLAPIHLNAKQAASGPFDAYLVRLRARLLETRWKQNQPTMTLESDGVTFLARINKKETNFKPTAFESDSVVTLTGICKVQTNHGGTPNSFEILLRSPTDVAVLQRPPWFNQKRLLLLAGALIVLLGAAAAWAAMLRHKVRQQTTTLREWTRREAHLKAQYQELFENANDIVFTLNLKGNLTSLNRKGESVIGYARDEALGAAFLTMVAPEYRETARRMFESKLRGGPPTTYELEIVAKRGHRVPIEVSTRLALQDGKPAGIQGIARDVTERKRAEKAILWERHLLRSLVDSSPVNIYFKDVESRFTLISKAQANLFGLEDPAQAIGKTDFDFFAEVHAHQARLDELEVIRTGRAIHQEEKETWPDGRVTWASTTKAPLPDLSGKVIGTFGISQDITELRLAQDELNRAKEAAESASRAKSEFLANMSHEIRTPMNGVIGMTELALDTTLTPEQRDYLMMVKDSADSLLSLINDILDFSKIEAGKLTLDPCEFSLHDHLANTVKALALRAHERGLELAWRAAPDVPRNLVGDPGRLRQVLVNLLGNAIKFTERGEVILSVEAESADTGKIDLHFAVKDTGIGIPLEKQRAIFDAFTQADASTTRKYGGTGLGLAITSRLVELMHGRLWLESEPGQGSTFHFTARFGNAKELQGQHDESQTISLRGLRVLVVDYNATNRRILDAMLDHWEMQSALASSGLQGLDLLEEAEEAGRPFALVLLDAQMPEMDGFSLAEKIKQNRRLAGATIMMLTSAGQRGDVTRCRELGIAVYLIKPIRQSDLLDAILMALGKTPSPNVRPEVVTRHTLREWRRKLRILLAEDNAVNQQLAVRLLEKQGHLVVVAPDGSEAISLLGKKHFDLVLMDVQMPKMDGLQATAAIRKNERVAGGHIPIIAMTAHAMQGDRERCLAAGMDDYVTKPIKAEEFLATVERAVPAEANSEGRLSNSSTAPALDHEEALAQVQGDRELLSELADIFLKDYPRLFAEVGRSSECGDAEGIERAAHALKGSVGNFFARPAMAAAAELEAAARAGDHQECRRLIRVLQAELRRVEPELSALARKTST